VHFGRDIKKLVDVENILRNKEVVAQHSFALLVVINAVLSLFYSFSHCVPLYIPIEN
jgi:hypothetical protein